MVTENERWERKKKRYERIEGEKNGEMKEKKSN